MLKGNSNVGNNGLSVEGSSASSSQCETKSHEFVASQGDERMLVEHTIPLRLPGRKIGACCFCPNQNFIFPSRKALHRHLFNVHRVQYTSWFRHTYLKSRPVPEISPDSSRNSASAGSVSSIPEQPVTSAGASEPGSRPVGSTLDNAYVEEMLNQLQTEVLRLRQVCDDAGPQAHPNVMRQLHHAESTLQDMLKKRADVLGQDAKNHSLHRSNRGVFTNNNVGLFQEPLPPKRRPTRPAGADRDTYGRGSSSAKWSHAWQQNCADGPSAVHVAKMSPASSLSSSSSTADSSPISLSPMSPVSPLGSSQAEMCPGTAGGGFVGGGLRQRAGPSVHAPDNIMQMPTSYIGRAVGGGLLPTPLTRPTGRVNSLSAHASPNADCGLEAGNHSRGPPHRRPLLPTPPVIDGSNPPLSSSDDDQASRTSPPLNYLPDDPAIMACLNGEAHSVSDRETSRPLPRYKPHEKHTASAVGNLKKGNTQDKQVRSQQHIKDNANALDSVEGCLKSANREKDIKVNGYKVPATENQSLLEINLKPNIKSPEKRKVSNIASDKAVPISDGSLPCISTNSLSERASSAKEYRSKAVKDSIKRIKNRGIKTVLTIPPRKNAIENSMKINNGTLHKEKEETRLKAHKKRKTVTVSPELVDKKEERVNALESLDIPVNKRKRKHSKSDKRNIQKKNVGNCLESVGKRNKSVKAAKRTEEELPELQITEKRKHTKKERATERGAQELLLLPELQITEKRKHTKKERAKERGAQELLLQITEKRKHTKKERAKERGAQELLLLPELQITEKRKHTKKERAKERGAQELLLKANKSSIKTTKIPMRASWLPKGYPRRCVKCRAVIVSPEDVCFHNVDHGAQPEWPPSLRTCFPLRRLTKAELRATQRNPLTLGSAECATSDCNKVDDKDEGSASEGVKSDCSKVEVKEEASGTGNVKSNLGIVDAKEQDTKATAARANGVHVDVTSLNGGTDTCKVSDGAVHDAMTRSAGSDADTIAAESKLLSVEKICATQPHMPSAEPGLVTCRFCPLKFHAKDLGSHQKTHFKSATSSSRLVTFCSKHGLDPDCSSHILCTKVKKQDQDGADGIKQEKQETSTRRKRRQTEFFEVIKSTPEIKCGMCGCHFPVGVVYLKHLTSHYSNTQW